MKHYHLKFVALHITPVCGHACPFCYMKNTNLNDVAIKKHPKLSDLLKIVDELHSQGVNEIALLGGDPGSYPHLLPLAKHIKELKIKTSILSNTLAFIENNNSAALEYLDSIESTIHSLSENGHDDFCNFKGAYKRLIKNLQFASNRGKCIGIALNIIPENASTLFHLVEKLKNNEGINISNVIIQRIIPFGMAAKSLRFQVNRNHAESALRCVRDIDEKLRIKISVEDPYPLCILPPEYKKYMTPCQWGITKAAINEKGDLSRCGADPRYLLGNIFKNSLDEIWNTSEILKSFRSRLYLPGRRQTCTELEQCGGGCPLSCEIDKDHGDDYLYLEYDRLDKEIHGELIFRNARKDELSSILQIEWSNFSEYGHIFTVEKLKYWYNHNPDMFFVVVDSMDWVLGYSAIVPITKNTYELLLKGELCSLTDFTSENVEEIGKSDYYHLEVLATIPSKTGTRAGRFIVKETAKYLKENACYITATPVTDMGIRLCNYFQFKKVSTFKDSSGNYPLYSLEIEKSALENKISKF